jgi:BirA family biotin operon repressor/biotin-[acetyl-CoA-carboxylase] ligase
MGAADLGARLAGRAFRYYESLPSTQDVALRWLRNGAPSGAVVIADEQTAGRGRQGHNWITPPGAAIALSVILRPSIEALAQVTMLGALAVAQTLDHFGAPDVSIKWPNDVRLGEQKISGVLPEVVWEGDRLIGVVLGIGVNISVDFSGTDLGAIAISLEPALGKAVDRAEVIVHLLDRLDRWTGQLGTPILFDAWKRRLSTLGQIVTVVNPGGTVRGVAERVDDTGALWVRDPGGQMHRIVAGDVLISGVE